MADEPLLESAAPGKPSVNASNEDHALRDLVARLVREQPYAVLCTQGEGQPYGSLVALAVTDDLSSAVFATPITTRKYRLLWDCDHVALVAAYERFRKCGRRRTAPASLLGVIPGRTRTSTP